MSYFDDNEARLIGLPAVLPPIRSVRRYTPPTPLEQRTAERDAARAALEVQCAQTRNAFSRASRLEAQLEAARHDVQVLATENGAMREQVAGLHGELSDVLGEVRAMLDGPDHVRSAAARLLRKRLAP